jgi:hypothetical protein
LEPGLQPLFVLGRPLWSASSYWRDADLQQREALNRQNVLSFVRPTPSPAYLIDGVSGETTMGRIDQIYSRTKAQYTASELRNTRAAYRRFNGRKIDAWITAAMRHKSTGRIIAVISALGFIGCVLILWRAT